MGRGTCLPKNSRKYFSGNYHVKFGHFVNFTYIYFGAKMSCPLKLTELLRLRTFVALSLELLSDRLTATFCNNSRSQRLVKRVTSPATYIITGDTVAQPAASGTLSVVSLHCPNHPAHRQTDRQTDSRKRSTRMVQLPATAAIEYVAACCITRTRTITKIVWGAYARSPQVQCLYAQSRLSVPSVVA